METNLFDVVLDADEKIIKTYKPNKVRSWFGVIAVAILFIAISIPIVIAAISEGETWYVVPGLLAMCLIIEVPYVVLIPFWINKTIYAVTNKRILIRTGYIGVDYKSLDYTLLGALTVNVSWVDKLIRKNTGSISFGSMASPMTHTQQSKFNFYYIQNPYETYKEIKAIIDEHKQK